MKIDQKLINVKLFRVSVRLGEWDLRSETDCQYHVCSDAVLDVQIKEIIVHEGYNAESITHEHDIALILLNRSVTATEWIKPICLPVENRFKNKSYDNISMDVAGWGYTSSMSNGQSLSKNRLKFFLSNI